MTNIARHDNPPLNSENSRGGVDLQCFDDWHRDVGMDVPFQRQKTGSNLEIWNESFGLLHWKSTLSYCSQIARDGQLQEQSKLQKVTFTRTVVKLHCIIGIGLVLHD